MSIKLFILGRPGSGKSTACRIVEKFLKHQEQYQGWSIVHYKDYQILTVDFDGFDVLDFSVLDTALVKLEKKAREKSSDQKEEVIIIEFARQNYAEAFKLFSPSFLKDSYFLFIEADVATCLERVKERIKNPVTADDFFVSEFIITEYYGKQIIPSVIKAKKGDDIDKNRVKMINSKGSLSSFKKKVEKFIQDIIKQEIAL